MGLFVNLFGLTFSRLRVMRENGRDNSGKVLWLCICDCGNKTTVRGNGLLRGITKSCGCIKTEMYKRGNKLIDLSGKRFGKLVVVHLVGTPRKPFWRCVCDCGNEKDVISSSLRHGYTNSCGCLVGESAKERFTKHGGTKTREYKIWKGITQRCNNQNNKAYKNYGGRGITICDSWASFDKFLDDIGKCPSPKHSIERNNVNGNYEPSNCRWATMTEQARNRRKQTSNTSGIVGINWMPRISKWASRITVDNERIYLGVFENIDDAKKARIEAELKYWNKLPS